MAALTNRYIKRKAEQEAEVAEVQAAKSAKAAEDRKSEELAFGGELKSAS